MYSIQTEPTFRRIYAAMAVVAGLILAALPSQAANIEEEAQKFVESMAQDAVKSLTDPAIPRPQRIENFRTLFTQRFAVEEIGKWVLGRHWNEASESERKEYLMHFTDLIVVSYVDRFSQYAGEKLNVTKVLSDSPQRATVFSEIVRPTSGGWPVNWVVSKRYGPMQVVDVVVEGVSMSHTMRSEYSAIIRQQGGKVAGLLDVMKERTASLKASGG